MRRQIIREEAHKWAKARGLSSAIYGWIDGDEHNRLVICLRGDEFTVRLPEGISHAAMVRTLDGLLSGKAVSL